MTVVKVDLLQLDSRTEVMVSDVAISGASKQGDIWWIPQGQPFKLTGNVQLPNGQMMVMVERVVDADKPIDDVRFIATIQDGQLTLPGVFEKSGNYVISAERLNRGLERIGMPIKLVFDTVEFDAFVPVDIQS